MRSIANELALIQNSISDEDLIVHIITQLEDEYNPIFSVIKNSWIPYWFSKLFDKLTDFERTLQDKNLDSPPTLANENIAQKHPIQHSNSQKPGSSFNSSFRGPRGNYGSFVLAIIHHVIVLFIIPSGDTVKL